MTTQTNAFSAEDEIQVLDAIDLVEPGPGFGIDGMTHFARGARQ